MIERIRDPAVREVLTWVNTAGLIGLGTWCIAIELAIRAHGGA